MSVFKAGVIIASVDAQVKHRCQGISYSSAELLSSKPMMMIFSQMFLKNSLLSKIKLHLKSASDFFY